MRIWISRSISEDLPAVKADPSYGKLFCQVYIIR